MMGAVPKDDPMFPRLPTVTKALLIANVVLFLLQQPFLLGYGTFEPFMLQPLRGGFDPFSPGGNFQPWQLLTYGFLHGGFGHLLFNMLALFMFGSPLEQTWGEKRFLTYYLVCVAGAGVCQLLVGALLADPAPVLGASGGIFGLLLAYAMLFPNQRVNLLIPPIQMKTRTFVILIGITELVMAATSWQPGIAHFAHLGGMIFGWLLIRYWRGQPPFKPRPPGGPRRPNHLRRVK
jgi:membrane associated rhomboid family serine protease